MKLNLGSGHNKFEGYVNIDILKSAKPDICMDMTREPLPFENESVDYIYSSHVFEHLGDFEYTLKECYRVMKDKATLFLILPYATSVGADSEYHTLRPRYTVFSAFEIGGKGMNHTLPQFSKTHRTLKFSKMFFFMNILNYYKRLVFYYEHTGLRYIFPALEVRVRFVK